MAGAASLGDVDADAVGDHHVQHAPQQMRAPPSRDRVEDDYHGTKRDGVKRIGGDLDASELDDSKP
jgi:hypothetical protein